jgi:hypothetical protein
MRWISHRSATVATAFLIAAMTLVDAKDLVAQAPVSTTIKVDGLSSETPDFSGNWRRDRSKYPNGSYSCGGLIGANGVPLSQCELPIDELRPYMHPRLLAWIQYAGPSDEYLSPRYDCVVDSLPTLLGDVYITSFARNSDKVIIHYEQGNRNREIWMDGRKHPPMTELFYMGHAVGWYEGDTLVIDTANFTFDVDGFDDHTHLATSHLKHLTERYRKTSPTTIELTITIEDPLFLKRPFTYKHFYRKTANDDQPVAIWECDPATSRRELSVMAPDKYEVK